jgi:hypothetical protein
MSNDDTIIKEALDDMIENWHTMDIKIPIWEFLGWSEEEYATFVEDGTIPK